ncbi:unnamed protein product [Lymnaea stagnalis]|uniref:Peptidase M12B domain-containing protein n=1 Tax=Lymnaea stagnalis TaxID=6523 RepID=A0AAV2HNW6_LYMST
MALCFKYTFLCSFLVFMCLALAHVLSEPLRHRRQTATSYVIDVGVVVDDVMFARWIQWIKDNTNQTNESTIRSLADTKVREYVSLTVHQANIRMSTLTPLLGYNISLQVVNVTTNQAVLGVSLLVDAQLALDTFRNWTTSRGLGSQFDHVILMTSKSLKSSGYESSNLTYQGRAYVAAMCRQDGFSASVVEDRGGFLSSLTLAHELAHSLGAQHDGEFNSTAINCPSTDHYIMAAVGTPTSQELADRPWYFSTCSATDISNNIRAILLDSVRKNCLTTNVAPIPEFTKSAVPGQLYPPNKQCQMVFGKDSRVCPQASGSLENICTSMDCLQPGGTNTCARHFAAEGTSCGSKKWCSKGQCVYSEAAPLIGDCYLGDTLTTIGTNLGPQSCAAAVVSFPELCYNASVALMCCESCKAIERNVPDCKYGDKVLGCNAKDCSLYDADGLAKCCGTCAKSPQNINNSRSTGSTVYALFTITLLTSLISILNTWD